MTQVSSQVKTRIAPSPTGDPHVGTAYQALFNYVFAKQNNGAFIVRIEDTDRARYKPEAQKRILEMLEWLNVAPDESPVVGGPSAPYIQTERAGTHQKYANQMLEAGKAYRAFDTTEELEARREAAEAAKVSYRGYDRRDRDLPKADSDARAAAGEPFVIRLKAPLEGSVTVHDRLRGEVVFQASELDDKVLLKADGFPTYHLAAMSDDHDMGVTHVIRAEEWLTSTPIHVLIIQAMGWDLPEWIHTPLLRNPDKSKLSKRKSNTSVESYRELGIFPEAILNYLGTMAFSMPPFDDGTPREVFSVQDLIEHFSWERVSLGGPVFDLEKLTWLNGKYIREVFTPADLAARANPFLERAGFDVSDAVYVGNVVHVLRERFNLLSELPEKAAYFFLEPDLTKLEEKPRTKLEEGKPHMPGLLAVLEGATAWDHATLEPLVKAFAESTGAKLGAVMQPLRVALTGRLESPGMFELLEVLGRQKTLERLQKAIG
jgi:glutamyl-tRNA synthetase